jgi:lipopolysaccharide transport system permease protein
MMFYYGFSPSIEIIYLPLLILLMMLTASGMGMWLTALSIQYRDINYGMGFFVQLLMYAAPVVYPASNVPEQFRLLYGCFPMAGVIEGFRAILLQTISMPWDLISTGSIVSLLLFISGSFYFRRMEKYFADVA